MTFLAFKQVWISKGDENTDSNRLGVILGSGIDGLTTIEKQTIEIYEKGSDRVLTMFIPVSIANMVAGNLSIKYHAQAISMTIVTACASGNNAIGEIYREIKDDFCDIIITGCLKQQLMKMVLRDLLFYLHCLRQQSLLWRVYHLISIDLALLWVKVLEHLF